MIEYTSLESLRARGGQDVELQNAKCPTDCRDSGASPCDRSLKSNARKAMFAQQITTGRRLDHSVVIQYTDYNLHFAKNLVILLDLVGFLANS